MTQTSNKPAKSDLTDKKYNFVVENFVKAYI